MRLWKDKIFPVLIILAAVTILCWLTFTSRGELRVKQYGFYSCIFAIVAGFIWCCYAMTSSDDRDLEKQLAHLQQREKALTEKLMVWQEWQEFPQPQSLANEIKVDDSQISELAERDQQVIELLKKEAVTNFQTPSTSRPEKSQLVTALRLCAQGYKILPDVQ